MDIFAYAIQMEEDGEQYYRQLAIQSPNKGLRTIFTMLADDEAKHRRVVEDMKAGRAEMAETNVLNDAINVFEKMKESGDKFDPDADQSEVYEKAQEIERKSREFYRQKANEIEKAEQKELFLKLAEEENKHFILLENLIAFVNQPKTWLENAEWFHLEEY